MTNELPRRHILNIRVPSDPNNERTITLDLRGESHLSVHFGRLLVSVTLLPDGSLGGVSTSGFNAPKFVPEEQPIVSAAVWKERGV